MKYRAEIDGLRAVAVLPVIFFHAGFEGFSGGYVGVDIFFVISGYLITTILINDIEQQRFSIVHFYERRARRILPALFFVMVTCLPFAWMWMHPAQFADFSQSLIAVSLFASNVLFWRESGYFETDAEKKPLLHTWSLAVEEQYYLLFPIFLFFAWRFGRDRVFWMIVVFAAISLMVSEWGARYEPSANFYLAPTRAWELFAGSIAAFFVQKHGVRPNNILSLLGLAAILVAIFIYDEETPFPSLYAVLPVGGVVLLILFADKTTFAARILSIKLLAGVGLISYSAYLWHQPLFAFLRINAVEEPSALTWLALSALSMGLAAFSWKYIEQPFRQKGRIDRRKIFVLSGIGMVFFITVGAIGYVTSHSLGAGAYNKINAYNFDVENEQLQNESWALLREKSGDKEYAVDHNDYDNRAWFPLDAKQAKILLIGNSHSKDLYNVFMNSRSVTQEYLVARYGVQIKDLTGNHALWHSPNYLASDIVIVISRYNANDLDPLKEVLLRLKQNGKRVFIVKSIFEFEEFRNGEWSLIDKVTYDFPELEKDPAALLKKVNSEYFRHYQDNNTTQLIKEINQKVVEMAKDLDIPVLDRMTYVCDHSSLSCYAMGQENKKLFYDYGHHTLRGSEFFGRRVDETNWLNKLNEE